MNGKLYFTILITFILIAMSMGVANAETIVGEPAKGTDTYAVKYGSTVRFANANSQVILGSSDDSGIKASGNEIYVGGLGEFTATVGGRTYKFYSWNAHLKSGSSVTYKDKSQSFSSMAEVVYADTYLVIEDVAGSKLCEITDYFFAKGGSYKGDTLIGKYMTNYYDKTRKNQSKQNNFEYSMEINDDVIIIGDEVTNPEPSEPEPSKPEPSEPEPSKPEPSEPKPSKPEPSKPEPSEPEPSEPEQVKKEITLPSSVQLEVGEEIEIKAEMTGFSETVYPDLTYDKNIMEVVSEVDSRERRYFNYNI